MTPVLYVHIGYHKTGTTTLQNFLWTHRPWLAARGCLYPDLPGCGPTHAPLANVLSVERERKLARLFDVARRSGRPNPYVSKALETADELYAALEHAILHSGLPKAVISSECFLEWIDPVVLQSRLGGNRFAVKVVVYVRRQDQWLQSVFNQLCKDPFFRYHGSLFDMPQVDLLDYASTLGAWGDAFGTENILVRPYEKTQLPHGILGDFLRTLEIGGSPPCAVEGSGNRRLSPEALTLVRLLNALDLPAPKHQKVLDALASMDGAETDESFEEHPILSPAEQVRLMEQFAAGNALIARRFLGRSDGRLFVETLPQANAVWSRPGSLTAEAIERFIERFSLEVDS